MRRLQKLPKAHSEVLDRQLQRLGDVSEKSQSGVELVMPSRDPRLALPYIDRQECLTCYSREIMTASLGQHQPWRLIDPRNNTKFHEIVLVLPPGYACEAEANNNQNRQHQRDGGGQEAVLAEGFDHNRLKIKQPERRQKHARHHKCE